MKRNVYLILMNLLYYFTIILLVSMMILPHTRIFYKWDIFQGYVERANTRTVYLKAGDHYQIRLFALNKRVTYKSTDGKVAGVTSVGKVFAFRPGKAIVNIKGKDFTGKFRFYVIKLSDTKITIKKEHSEKLKVRGKILGIHWSSSNEKIAKVSRFGRVEGIGKGTTTITAKVKGVKLTCKVTVK